ncbi:peptidylprolyl isomerase [Lacticigenium naphthae]|uniref:peptidylprolyl isomerase n=1 Tax=Lacticigenium naphthae TaxID=515351 RepID=UPI00041636A0|nr:peptidylprolyl isomerase [Lacticigenium naphthae]
MKKYILSAILLSGLTLAGCSGEDVASSTAGKINQDDFYEEMKENYGSAVLQQMLLEDVLNEKYGDVVTDERLDETYNQEVERFGGEEALEYALQSQGISAEDYKANIRLNLLVEEAVKENADFSKEEIQAAYDEYQPTVTAAHILVEEEEKAVDLISQINEGADFAELAKEHSTDTGSAEQGGELTFGPGEMVPEFETAAYSLDEGEVAQEPVKSEYGYHIVKTIEKSEKGSLEDESENIESLLLEEKLADDAYVQSVLSKIVQDANIQIMDDDLSDAMQAFMPAPEVEETEGMEDSAQEAPEDSETTDTADGEDSE